MTPTVPDLSCRELVELVTGYLEEKLPVDDRTRFELHLTYCDACRTYLRQMREVVRSARAVTEESIGPEARDALLAAFRGWKRGPGGDGP
jgi:anti-sigma factor RsiW